MLDSASFQLDDWGRQIDGLLGGFDLEEAARSSRALVRRRGVPSARALLRLALAHGPGGLSLRQTSAWARRPEALNSADDCAVDVVIPVRDGARFIKACLDSVLAQSRAP